MNFQPKNPLQINHVNIQFPIFKTIHFPLQFTYSIQIKTNMQIETNSY